MSQTLERTVRRFMPSERTRYQLRNTSARLRAMPLLAVAAIARHVGAAMILSELRAVHHKVDGTSVDLGVISHRLVTTAGVNYLASTFLNTGEPENFNYHASGTGATAENITDTAMGTDSGVSRVAGTQSNPSANIYQTVATMAYVSTKAITEHGVFSASTAGTLLDRSVFTAVNVVSGDSIAFTYALTLTAGG